MKKISIGFDLGSASVGWSIISHENDKTLSLLDMGVRIYDDPKDSCKSRRLARSVRRNLRRKNYRQFCLFNLLLKNKIIDSIEEFSELVINQPNNQMPFEVKNKGLSNELSKHELVYIMHSYIKKRGYFLEKTFSEKYYELIDELKKMKYDLENLDPEKDSKKIIQLSNKISKKEKDIKKEEEKDIYDFDPNIFPCENQANWFKKYGIVNTKKNYLFSNEHIIEEINAIFKNQNESFKKIRENFIKIVSQKREYWQGPGSENSFTVYGRFDEHKNWMGNESKLWNKVVGKCSWFENEERTFAFSPKYQLFNLINNLSNLNFRKNAQFKYLSIKEIREFLSYFLSSKNIKEISIDHLLNWLNKKDISYNEIYGLKKNKKGEHILFDSIKELHLLMKFFGNLKLIEKIDKESLEFLNDFFKFFLIEGNEEKSIQDFIKNKKDIILSKENKIKIEDFVNKKTLLESTSKLIKRGKLSERAIDSYIEYALFSNNVDESEKMLNQSSFYLHNLKKINSFSKVFYQKDGKTVKKYFPKNIFSDEIMPLSVKRTFEQAINVLNAILKQYVYSGDYELKNITIELARELNSSEEKKKIEEANKKNEKWLGQFKDFYKNEKWIEKYTNNDFYKNKEKICLWLQQHGKDVYDLNEKTNNILFEDIMNGKKYEVDHIFPWSVTYDNSFENKVLTKQENNQIKTNKTPYEWINDNYKNFNHFKSYWENIYRKYPQVDSDLIQRTSSKKLERLCFEGTINEIDFSFSNRNLNDTRYVTSLFFDKVKTFFENSPLNPKIKCINGVITSYVRRNVFNLKKDRSQNKHHAEDALICALLGQNSYITNEINRKYKQVNELKNNSIENILKNKYGHIIEYSKNQKCKFSTIQFKNVSNMKLSDILPISAKMIEGNYYEVVKIPLQSANSNSENKKPEKYFSNEENTIKTFYENNKIITDFNIYNELNKIYINYKLDNKNPFIAYAKELKDLKLRLKLKDDSIVDYNEEYGIPIFIDKKIDKPININQIQFIKSIKALNSEIKIDDKLEINKKEIKTALIDKMEKYKQFKKTKLTIDNNKKSNKISYFDSLKWNKLIIFKDNDKIVPLYLTAKYLKYKNSKLIEDKNKIIEFLKKNNIFEKYEKNINDKDFFNNNSRDKVIIYKGLCIWNKKEERIYRIIGGSQSEKKIELKPLDKIEYKIKKNSSTKKELVRYIISLPKFFEKYDHILYLDHLGNIRKKIKNLC